MRDDELRPPLTMELDIAEAVAQLKADPPGSSYLSFGDFEMDTNGLYYVRKGKNADPPIRLSDPFEVVARTRDALGEAWGKLLRWRDPERRSHEWIMPVEIATSGHGGHFRRLSRGGLEISTTQKGHTLLCVYLGEVAPLGYVRSVTQIGSHDRIFVLPTEAFGEEINEPVRLQTETYVETFYNVAGTADDWRREIGQKCIDNSRLVFAVSSPPSLDRC